MKNDFLKSVYLFSFELHLYLHDFWEYGSKYMVPTILYATYYSGRNYYYS